MYEYLTGTTGTTGIWYDVGQGLQNTEEALFQPTGLVPAWYCNSGTPYTVQFDCADHIHLEQCM